MDFFNDLGDSIASVGKEVTEKAKDVFDFSKTHALIASEEVKIKEQYYKLGRKYYELFGDIENEALSSYIEKIHTSLTKIEELRANLKKDCRDDEDETEDEIKFVEVKLRESNTNDADYVDE